MSENTFDPQEINLQFQPLPAFIDPDGTFKLNTPMLSSFNFDGSIPKFDGNIDAIDIKPGYLIQTEVGGQYYPVVSVESDDPDVESTGLVTINYIDDLGNKVSQEYGETDQVAVVYENWSEKILGSQGWGITAEGNAIFTNVAVRGRIEAEEGYISGSLVIGQNGTSTFNDLTTEEDVENYINDLNDRISASISDVYIDVDNLSSSMVFLYEAGFVSSAQLITTGATTINGNNITTGVINANVVRITSASSLVQNRAVQFSAVGLEGYTNTGERTFFLSTDGTAEFKGTITGSTITGSTFQTATSGRRIQIDTAGGYSNNISMFSSSGDRSISMGADTWTEGATTYSGLSIRALTGNQALLSIVSRSGGDGSLIVGEYDSDNGSIVNRTNLSVAGTIVSGTNNGGGGSILCYGRITSISGSVVAPVFYGDGSQLTNIAAGNAYRNAITTPTPANKITFGTGDPPGSGRTTGDIHLRYT
jgi:hypothetical protein